MPRKPKGWKVWVEPSGENYRCRWYDLNGQPGQQTFVLKSDARELELMKRREFERAAAGLPALPNLSKRPDYAAFRADYLRWLDSRRSARTRYLAERALELYEEGVGDFFPSRKHIADFSDWLMTRPAIRSTGERANGVRVTLRHVKAALRWAYKDGRIDYDPFLHFEMPAAVSVARLMTGPEVAALMAEIPEVCRRALLFSVFTGLRISEVLRLDWSTIWKETRQIRDQTVEIWYLTVLKSKTRRAKAETKTQAIHPVALTAMGAPRKFGPVFDVKLSRLEQRLRAAVVKLGMGRVRWHDMRHTWATHLLQNAKDLKAVMGTGGWSTQEAAMVYQHDTNERRDVTLENRYEVPFQPLISQNLPDDDTQKA